jgi:nitroimidazol reductase NimA-like FMN-containing flavoprotein (pyridoxamine 5'-phosphate oxidase superfamily)
MSTSGRAWVEDLSLEECLRLLREQSVGRIVVVPGVDESPIVVPVNYRLVETSGLRWVAVRTRPGNVIDRAPMNVAFEIDNVNLLEHEGWSVLVRGMLHHVDPDAAEFRDRFDPEPWLAAERDSWLAIEPFAITGRRLHAAEREWAFYLNAYA